MSFSFMPNIDSKTVDSGWLILFSLVLFFFLLFFGWLGVGGCFKPPCILHLPGLLVSGEVNNFQEKEIIQGSYSLSYFLSVFTKVCRRLLTLGKVDKSLQ